MVLSTPTTNRSKRGMENADQPVTPSAATMTSPSESNISANVTTPQSAKMYSPIRCLLRNLLSPLRGDATVLSGLRAKPFRMLNLDKHMNHAPMFRQSKQNGWVTYNVCLLKIEKGTDTTLVVLRNFAGQIVLTLDTRHIDTDTRFTFHHVMKTLAKSFKYVSFRAFVKCEIGFESMMLKFNYDNTPTLVATLQSAIAQAKNQV